MTSDKTTHAGCWKSWHACRVLLWGTVRDLNAVSQKLLLNSQQKRKFFLSPAAPVTQRSSRDGITGCQIRSETLRVHAAWRCSHIWVSSFWANVTWGKMRAMTQLENKGPVIAIHSVSPPSPSFHRDNWISRRVTLVCPGCQRDIQTVSFGGRSEARGQKWDLQPFSVKLLLTTATKTWRIAPLLRKSSVGVHRVCGEKKQQQQSPQYREFLHFSSFWSHGDGVCGESGFKWSWQITAEGYRGGLVSQGDREARLTYSALL